MATSYRILRDHDGANGSTANQGWPTPTSIQRPTRTRHHHVSPDAARDYIVSTSPAPILTKNYGWSSTTTPPTRSRKSATGWMKTPASERISPRPRASWMNVVEIWFGIIERQAIHRGTFGNVRELTTAIRTYYHRLQQPGPPIRQDGDPRGNPQESQPSPNSQRGPPASIEIAKYSISIRTYR
jgi:hypothetical protein